MTLDEIRQPSLRDPDVTEWFVRLGLRHAVETVNVLTRVDDRRLRREGRRAAREAVAQLVRAYEHTFLTALESALSTPPGGTLKTTIHLGKGNDIIVENRIGADA